MSINPCTCNGTPIIVVDPGPSCEDCLKVYSLRIGCDEGPWPGGGEEGTVVIDLATINDVTACEGCEGVYTVYSFDEAGIESATTTEAGVLTIVTDDTFLSREEYEVVYKFSCPCMKTSMYGTIYVCKKDLCFGVECDVDEVCDPTSGLCVPE